jgi:hypothetical protein
MTIFPEFDGYDESVQRAVVAGLLHGTSDNPGGISIVGRYTTAAHEALSAEIQERMQLLRDEADSDIREVSVTSELNGTAVTLHIAVTKTDGTVTSGDYILHE